MTVASKRNQFHRAIDRILVLTGYSMAGIGFLMVSVIILSYIFNWDNLSPAFAVMGIIFIATGLKISHRQAENREENTLFVILAIIIVLAIYLYGIKK